jgi:1L-myo-inositol 1-phosphate cytidylyltransferase
VIDLAVILAAGSGSRLRHHVSETHKALVSIGGEPILLRNCRLLDHIGVSEIIVVTGYRGEELRSALTEFEGLNATLTFVDNERWKLSNGLSVLAAADRLDRNYLLLMADHLFAADLLETMAHVDPGADNVVLAIDRKLESVYDMEDATKVVVSGNQIVEIGKELVGFNGVDTGVFACSSALVESLRKVEALKGDCSLTDGVRGLATLGRFRGFDIGDSWWQDVDTPEALTHGTMLLKKHLIKDNRIAPAQHQTSVTN